MLKVVVELVRMICIGCLVQTNYKAVYLVI